jgi:hypothetical protein
MDLVVRAIYEDPVEIDSLLRWLSPYVWHQCDSENTNVSLDLRHRLLVE